MRGKDEIKTLLPNYEKHIGYNETIFNDYKTATKTFFKTY